MSVAADEAPEEHRVVGHDRFDELVWREALKECRLLRELRDQGREVHPGFGGLLADLHAGLYKPDPQLLPEDQVPATARWQRDVVARSWEGREWAQTRDASVLDEVLSAVGTLATGQAALEWLEERTKPLRPASGDQGAPAGRQGEGEATQAVPGDTQPGMTPQEMRVLARAVRHAAKEEVAETQQALAAWGIDPGELRRLPLGQRIELAQRLTREKELTDLAPVVGAMRALAAGLHRRRVTARPAEIVGVETGRDVRRLLPAELARLAHPVLRYEAMRRLASGQMLQWRKAARERQGRGPLIVLCDASGSTQGRQELLIKGIALGLVEIARRQRRNFAGVVFGSKDEIATFEFPAGRADPEVLLGFATTFFSGGTDWESPLREALRLQALSPHRQGDVVLITDGLCALTEALTAGLAVEKKARDLRIVGVLAQAGAHAAGAMGFCDRVIQSADLAKAAADVLQSVVEESSEAS